MAKPISVQLPSNSTTGYLLPEEWTPERIGQEGWSTRKADHPSHVWAWIIIVVIIIIIGIFIIFNSFWEDNKGLGEYAPPVRGQCNGTNICTDPGTRVVTRVCVPHPTTGKGCLIPSGDQAGTQSYQSLITVEPCQTHCVNSAWKEVTPEDQPCLLPDLSENECVPQGTFGTKLRRFRCVNNDETGTNECTSLGLEEILGPTSQPGTKLVLSTKNVGDEVEIDTTCQDFDRQTCGEWLWAVPPPSNQPEPLMAGITMECLFDTNLIPVQDCIVESNPANRDPRWDNLREGYQIFPLSCIYQPIEDDTLFGVTPLPTDPPVNQCPRLSPPECRNMGIVPEQVRDGNIPTDGSGEPNSLLCAGTLRDGQNPTCYRPCREFRSSFPTIGNGEFNPILGKLLSIRWPEGFLSLRQLPGEETETVEAIEINFGLNKPGCSQTATEFATTLLLSLGPRNYNSGTLEIQMMGLIGGSCLGWMGVKNINGSNRLFWQQAYNIYQGPGITSANPAASRFQVMVTSPFNPNPPTGFVPGTIGTIGLSIQDQSGGTIMINSDDGVSNFTLDNVQAIVYNPDTLNSDSRNDIGPLNCNLLI